MTSNGRLGRLQPATEAPRALRRDHRRQKALGSSLRRLPSVWWKSCVKPCYDMVNSMSNTKNYMKNDKNDHLPPLVARKVQEILFNHPTLPPVSFAV